MSTTRLDRRMVDWLATYKKFSPLQKANAKILVKTIFEKKIGFHK